PSYFIRLAFKLYRRSGASGAHTPFGKKRGFSNRMAARMGRSASQHIVDVAEPAEIDVSRAPNSLAVLGRGEGQVNHFALEIEEAAQRGPGRHAAAKDVVEDQALMAASRIEPERRIVAEIVAVPAGLGVSGFAGDEPGPRAS